jgi:DNA end-binding protein Ku
VLYFEKLFRGARRRSGEEAYGVLRDALRQTKRVGLGQLSVRGREQLVIAQTLWARPDPGGAALCR